MPAIQNLKKQLRGIRSTQKLTKAMKTTSTVKFSKLNGIYGEYAVYGRECVRMFEQFGAGFTAAMELKDPEAPRAVVVLGSNKGLCGSFNSELQQFARNQLIDGERVVACGKKAIQFFRSKNIPVEKEVVFGDIPTYEESAALLDELLEWRKSGKISGISVVYPRYTHMMKQIPTVHELFASQEEEKGQEVLYVPDRITIVEKAAKNIFNAMFFQLVLEAALGAQAATLMTMRSAYDTATEYCTRLEAQINRKRQSAVTADVLETAAEWGEE